MGKSPKVPTAAAALPAYHLDVQTSIYGSVVPIFFGEISVPPNIVWADFFQHYSVAPAASGSKKGGQFASYQYTYSVSTIIALGEGAMRNDDNPVRTIDRLNAGLMRPAVSVNPVGDIVIVHGTPQEMPGGIPDGLELKGQKLKGVEPGIKRAKRIRAVGPKQGPFRGMHFHPWEGDWGPVVDLNGHTVRRYISRHIDVITDAFQDDDSRKQHTKITTPGGRHYAPETYYGTAVMAIENMMLGSNASLPNLNVPAYRLRAWETEGYTGVRDALPDVILRVLLTSPKEGIGWDTALLMSLIPGFDGTLLDASHFWKVNEANATMPESWWSYVRANEMWISPSYNQQTTLAQIIDELCLATDSVALYSEGLLKMIPLGDTPVTGPTSGVTYTPASDPVAYTTGANVAIRVDLERDDLLGPADNDPLVVHGKALTPDDQTSAGFFNIVTVEFKNRHNGYQIETAPSIDEASVNLIGPVTRAPDVMHEITSRELAQSTADRIRKRFAEKRNTHEFTLGWWWGILIEPLDYVTAPGQVIDVNITDRVPLRITSTAEDPNFNVRVEAERAPRATQPVAAPIPPSPTDTVTGFAAVANGYAGNFAVAYPGFISLDLSTVDADPGVVAVPLSVARRFTRLVVFPAWLGAGEPTRIRIALWVDGAIRDDFAVEVDRNQLGTAVIMENELEVAAGSFVCWAYIPVNPGPDPTAFEPMMRLNFSYACEIIEEDDA